MTYRRWTTDDTEIANERRREKRMEEMEQERTGGDELPEFDESGYDHEAEQVDNPLWNDDEPWD